MTEQKSNYWNIETGFLTPEERVQAFKVYVSGKIGAKVGCGITTVTLGCYAAAKYFAPVSAEGGGNLPEAFLFLAVLGGAGTLYAGVSGLLAKEKLMYNEMEITRKKREADPSKTERRSFPTHQPI